MRRHAVPADLGSQVGALIGKIASLAIARCAAVADVLERVSESAAAALVAALIEADVQGL